MVAQRALKMHSTTSYKHSGLVIVVRSFAQTWIWWSSRSIVNKQHCSNRMWRNTSLEIHFWNFLDSSKLSSLYMQVSWDCFLPSVIELWWSVNLSTVLGRESVSFRVRLICTVYVLYRGSTVWIEYHNYINLLLCSWGQTEAERERRKRLVVKLRLFLNYMYCRIPQIRPPFLHLSIRQNRGGGLCLRSWSCRVTTITNRWLPWFLSFTGRLMDKIYDKTGERLQSKLWYDI